MIFEGALLDLDGPRRGYLRIDRGRILEAGAIGTDSRRGRERRIRGIAVPRPVNAHTHLGDAAYPREPPPGPVSRIVAPPHGIKFRVLAETPAAAKRDAIRGAMVRMEREGTGAVIDFREEGLAGVELLRSAARGRSLTVFALGRPLRRPIDRTEVRALLRLADGIAVSSAREESYATRSELARACRAAGKRYALHASEVVREPVEEYLRPRPDLLVHLFRANEADLRAVAEAKVPVAVCPRSNALFGHAPDLARFDRLGIPLLLGTDNAMFASSSILRELEFAYVSARLRRRPVAPRLLVRAAFHTPWGWLGRPDRARLVPGAPAPLIFRLPDEDPEYQIVTRAAEHLMVLPERHRGTR